MFDFVSNVLSKTLSEPYCAPKLNMSNQTLSFYLTWVHRKWKLFHSYSKNDRAQTRTMTDADLMMGFRQQQQQQILCQQWFIRYITQSPQEPGDTSRTPTRLRHSGGELAVEHDPAHSWTRDDDVPDSHQVHAPVSKEIQGCWIILGKHLLWHH